MLKARWRLALVLFIALGGSIWRYQSELLGMAAGWYLGRVARSERQSGDLSQRRDIVARTHRMLLMPPPADGLVPELFDLTTALAARGASGAISLNWSAYIYTSYYLELARDRPSGTPARSPEEVAADLDRYVEFYALQKRPNVPGLRVSDLMGTNNDTYSLEEIEKAEREGHPLPLR